jgi:hypothetical protein
MKSDFKFHFDKIDLYMRFQRTSIYYTNEIDIKGNYKEPPNYIFKNILPVVIKNEYDQVLNKLTTIYDIKYFNFLKHLSMAEEITKYYKFGNKYFLDFNGKKTTDINNHEPFSILRFFLFPIIELLRTN